MGGALFPWAYTILFLVTHVPVVFIRVVRFDLVQYFCIGSAILAVYLAIQEYVSTGFETSKVLLWSPLLLVIDAGAMLQVFFLVIEGVAVKVGQRTILMEPGEAPEDEILPQSEPLLKSIPERFKTLRRRLVAKRGRDEGSKEVEEAAKLNDKHIAKVSSQQEHDLPSPWPARIAATISAMLFIAIVVLQILGIQAAFKKGNLKTVPVTTWCSPGFQPFGVAMMDGDCNRHEIIRRNAEGIGCVDLPGLWQREWLYISGIGTLICLICEGTDMVFLALVNGKSKFRLVKLKRPWSTMILGLVALGITLFYGVQYANSLPYGITHRVLIVVDAGNLMGFDGELVSAGLRGSLIGWSDGLFSSWGKAYFGS